MQKNNNNKKVLVLDAHSPAALAVVRSLARTGLRVDVAGEEGQFNLVFHSKYPRKKICYPSPSRDIPGFLEFIEDILIREQYRFLFPITDRTILPLHEFRGRFDNKNPALPPPEPLETTLDKAKTIRLAQRLGVPVPLTYSPRKIEEAAGIAGDLPYPVVIKARSSKRIFDNRLIADNGPEFCDSTDSLIRTREKIDKIIPDPLIQEMIRGDGYGISLLMKAGRPRAIFAHHRLREEEPLGARSSFCESVAPPPEMKEYAIRLLSELNWTGPAMVEFKLDQRDSIPKLMEINGRFWGSLPLAIAAGVDFPYLYFQMLEEGRDSPELVGQDFSPALDSIPCNYRIGLKARFLYADIQHLINVLRGRPQPWMTYPGKLKTIIDFIKSFRPGIKYFNLDLRDPMPGIRENARFLFNELPGRLLKKKTKSST